MSTVYDIADRYGVPYSGELVDGDYHERVDHSEGHYSLAEVQAGRGRITRVRVLKDPGYNAPADVSYIHATMPGGRIVPVRVEIGPCPYGTLRRRMVEWAKGENVYAKGLGLLDPAVWSVM